MSTDGRFNGVIKSNDGPVTVKHGFAVVDKELYMVSDDGYVITDKDKNIVAVVIDGKASALTPDVINSLREKGYIEPPSHQ